MGVTGLSELSTESLVTILALVGSVIIIAALLSGLIERSGFPQIAVFLLMGAIIGPAGLGVFDVTLTSPILHIVATLSLVLVLFTDAIALDLEEVRRSSRLTLLILGPGTLLTAALVALLAWAFLHLSIPASILIGAALASTDPVLLRGFLRLGNVPSNVKQGLRLESGLNDIVLLPIVLVAMTFLQEKAPQTASEWARIALDLFVLGPGAGILIGVCGVATMAVIRRNIGIRREYESLYSLGIAFTAYAAAEAVHGSGFLAAFAAGFVIAALDVEMCDCFLEYGETTAELTLLFTFVLFGTSLIWSGLTILSLPLILFAICALLVRPFSLLLSLVRERMTRKERLLISWFGPRGLSSLLLVLLPVFSGISAGEQLFEITSVVVLLSILVHGGSSSFIVRRNSHTRDTQPPHVPEEASEQPASTKQVVEFMPREQAQIAMKRGKQAIPDRLTLDEIQRLQKHGKNIYLIDARKTRSYEKSDVQAKGSLRIDPDHAVEQVRQLNLPLTAWLIPYCT